MFNWYGNHKIGILGAANSGKTILLTSLLWHLSHHDVERFVLSSGKKIYDFKIKKREKNNFNFTLHKNTFTQKHCWPEKTSDFAVADCRYIHKGKLCERHIKFVDIPGERVSDILLWKARSYSEWVELLFEFWQENPRIKDIIDPYWELANTSESSLEQLNTAYKTAMWQMLEYYCPITPSTYYLGTDGQMLGDKNNYDKQKTIQARPIWSGGELLPVPAAWAKDHPKEYKELEINFKLYKKMVLKPLFDEINSCDNFIFCVDILNILMSGPELLLQSQREFKDFIEHLAPNKIGRWLNAIGNNPPRLAFVATKSDMVSSVNKDKLQYLLNDFAAPITASGIKYSNFICSACESTQEKVDSQGIVRLVGRDCDAPQNYVELKGDLPEYWPDKWDGSNYIYPEVVPIISATKPPKQVNLNKLFEFIIEDKEREIVYDKIIAASNNRKR